TEGASPRKRPGDGVNIRLIPCNICHRQFKEDRLDKHSSVCEKIHQSKRKTFDSSKYRAKGTDLENFMKTNDQCKTPELKKNNWRQKHEAFIRNLRQVRGPSTGDFQPQSSSDLNPDYITCPHCGRHFAPGPAERHIPKCQNIKSRPPPPRHQNKILKLSKQYKTHQNTKMHLVSLSVLSKCKSLDPRMMGQTPSNT
uniref:C2HC/C3H-type domain-containing protein n=1 Tax=Electrophorus electricus TaxID=8005 RepID=A0A4W4GY32_ELEEL